MRVVHLVFPLSTLRALCGLYGHEIDRTSGFRATCLACIRYYRIIPPGTRYLNGFDDDYELEYGLESEL